MTDCLRPYVASDFTSAINLRPKLSQKKKKENKMLHWCTALISSALLNSAFCQNNVKFSQPSYMITAAMKASPPIAASGGTMLCVESEPGTCTGTGGSPVGVTMSDGRDHEVLADDWLGAS